MINLYSARENIDKERFIYESITGEAIVIVPDQYTLVAEEQALKYLNTKCLYDVEIMSMNRLGLRVLQEQGKENTKILDQYGRFMLLSRIIKKHKADFDIYQKSAGKPSFTLMLSDFISQFKQQDCTLDDLKELLGADETDELLKSKLNELELIVKEYQDSLGSKYTDAEDYISLYISAIKNARFLDGKSIWVYGFDTLTPKFIKAVLELSLVTNSVNIVINESDFHLEEVVVKQISYQAKEMETDINVASIEDEFSSRAASKVPSYRDDSEPLFQANVSEGLEEPMRISSGSTNYLLDKTETIRLLEGNLFSNQIKEYKDFIPEDLKLVRCANPYYEAESAANYIYHLIRDEKYLMRDIQIIANDAGTMQPIVKRTFEEYGLPVFMDQPRSITDTAAVSFIMNLLWFVKYGKTDVLMAMLKTGLAGYEYSDIEELENYAAAYKIKGNMWKNPFRYGEENIGEEKFARLEDMRAGLSDKISKLSGKGTVLEFVNAFKKYLDEEWELLDRVTSLAEKQVDNGLFDEAQRMVESYQKALELLDQINEIMGEEDFELSEFIDIYLTGLKNVEVGVIPQALDGLSMGTMIRTRPRPTRAVVILGANEGTLPLKPSTEGLFSVDEKNYFKERGFALGALDDIKMDEENVAMYRMMSKPSEKLYISYSMTDADGGEAEPSEIIDSLIELFPKVEIEKDIISAGWTSERINAKGESMRHLVNHLKDKNTENVDPLAEAVLSWMEQNQPSETEDMMNILRDENDPKGLGHNMAKSLYSRKDGNIVLSASAISGYFECPFKYFIDRGLKPQEDRKFVSDPRSIGDVYHKCLENIAMRIVDDREYGIKIAECSDVELEKLISTELDKIAKDYNGGLFVSSGNEEYRMQRIKEICAAAVRAVAKQLTDEAMKSAKFEAFFGRSGDFDPIEFELDGEKVYVEGKIDRTDFFNNDSVRIIDYKTGSDKLDTWKMSQGYKMQLMIYLISATSGKLEPAGMYYFNIKDPIAKYNDIDENKKKRDGSTIADKTVDEMFELKGKTFDDKQEFGELKKAVLDNMEKIASGISAGKIDIKPFKDNKKLVCGYCQYKAICKRDRNYVRNMGWELKPKVKEEKA